MTDKNVNKNSIINLELPASIDTAVKNITDKPTAAIGETISDCFFLVFGAINQKAALKRAKYALELECFKNELQKKLNEVPESKRIEPNIQTIFTTLDNMRFCVEEKELRDLFANLIANSINADNYTQVHPSYGEIIKQLTPFDANVFKWMNKQAAIPVFRIRIENKDHMSHSLLPTYYLSSNFENEEKLQIALNNLARLGLIEIVMDFQYVDNGLYEKIKATNHLKAVLEDIDNKINKEIHEINFNYGKIEITEFGKNFYEMCN